MDVSPGRGGAPIVLHGPSEIRRATVLGRIFSYIDYKLFYRDPIARPVTLREWLSRLDWVEGVLLDLRPGVDLSALARAVTESGFSWREVEASSSDHELLARLKREIPEVPVLASIADKIVGLGEYLAANGFDGASLKYTIIDESLARQLKNRGLRVYAWTVNDGGEARRLAGMGVEGIITDVPWRIRKTLGG